ncbi:porin family protein [Brevundimonas sp.]|uniref:porin family protein n=1 Tax=Brevundimonas sp. TaxID=1871086 RepID=UPI002D4BDB4C|nr:porin family protein [Brevundimonas sp.]HYC75627.1 porin family protein [Brevundimonas sp.]
MRNLLIATAALSAFAAPGAMAQSVSAPQIYGTLGYSQLDAEGLDFGAVTGRLGAKFTPHLGIEGEASFGVTDEEVALGIPGTTIEQKYDVGAYVVGYLPINSSLELFGRVGYGTTEFEATATGVTTDESFDGLAYGAGGNWFFDENNGVRADWTRRDFGDDGEADVWSLSYIRRF